jgi:hypothetical protein
MRRLQATITVVLVTMAGMISILQPANAALSCQNAGRTSSGLVRGKCLVKVRVRPAKRATGTTVPGRSATTRPAPQPEYYPDTPTQFISQSGTCWRYANGPAQEPCPPIDPTGGTPPPANIPGWMYRAAARPMIKPPAPELFIAPGFALPGKKAFLESDGPDQYTATGIAYGDQVSWTCAYTSSYVDWGDGSASGRSAFFRYESGEWPDGGVWHIYDEPGNVTVDVTDYWSCILSVNGTPQDVPIDSFSTNTFPIEIIELQVIVTEGNTNVS